MVRPGPSAPLWGAAGKVGYALSCTAAAVVLAVSGFSYFIVRDVSSIGGSHAILSGPSIGAQNILLMGLESRKDWDGNILPDDVLSALHAGSRQGIENGVGGNATNTLILIHIPAGGKKAIGFSIPRDDWVTFPTAYDGQSQGKIDQAYGLALAAKETQVQQQDPKATQKQVAFQGNEAGRAAAVATVQQLTGVHIDHFAEINLDGFYELARVLGGVNVCLRHRVAYDSFSGFYSHRAGYQHLNAKMALAFVRQRHGLTQGDLDRTHRQQAFLDSIIEQLRAKGVLGDLTSINSLLSVAKQYVITDSGWNLLDFITQMRSLTAGNISFRTAPVVTTDGHMAGQDVNLIDPAYIQQVVHEAFYPSGSVPAGSARTGGKQKAAPASSITVDVYNGGYRPGLAKQVSDGLVAAGYTAGQIATASTHPAITEVLYGTGASGNAAAIASVFGVTAQAGTSVTAGHVQIVLSTAATLPNFGSLSSAAAAGSASSGSASSSGSPGPSPSATSSADDGQAGGIVSAMGKSSHGIPCVN
jgi:LCP family protein required for cell wall assembly